MRCNPHDIPDLLFAQLLQAFRTNRSRAALAVLEAAAHLVVGAQADAGKARFGFAFQAGAQVHRGADGRVIHQVVGADVAQHGVTGTDTDPDGEGPETEDDARLVEVFH